MIFHSGSRQVIFVTHITQYLLLITVMDCLNVEWLCLCNLLQTVIKHFIVDFELETKQNYMRPTFSGCGHLSVWAKTWF